MMHTDLWVIWTVHFTPWTILAYFGTFLFTVRWLVQAWASKMAGKPTVPRLFWYMSIVGSLILLFYFIWGKNDGPGIVSNLFPGLLAVYNLFLDFTHERDKAALAEATPEPVGAAAP